MDINLFRGLMTALLLVLFVGVWVWAWLPSRKRDFDEAARLPLDEDSAAPKSGSGSAIRDRASQKRSHIGRGDGR